MLLKSDNYVTRRQSLKVGAPWLSGKGLETRKCLLACLLDGYHKLAHWYLHAVMCTLLFELVFLAWLQLLGELLLDRANVKIMMQVRNGQRK